MEYVIESVVKKCAERPNKWHAVITGKRCSIERLWMHCSCILRVEGLVEWEASSRFHTSPIRDARCKEGKLIVETENSVYTLVPVGKDG